MDLVGPFVKTSRGNLLLLVIVDRYTILLRTVSLQWIEDIDIVRSSITNWVYVCGIPDSLLADDGKQFNSRLMLEVHRIIEVKELFTTTYHLQNNGYTERMNRTILSTLRKLVSENPIEWDLHNDAVNYAYNAQCHESTGLSTFELVLSRPSREWFIDILKSDCVKGEKQEKLSDNGLHDYASTWTKPLMPSKSNSEPTRGS